MKHVLFFVFMVIATSAVMGQNRDTTQHLPAVTLGITEYAFKSWTGSEPAAVSTVVRFAYPNRWWSFLYAEVGASCYMATSTGIATTDAGVFSSRPELDASGILRIGIDAAPIMFAATAKKQALYGNWGIRCQIQSGFKPVVQGYGQVGFKNRTTTWFIGITISQQSSYGNIGLIVPFGGYDNRYNLKTTM